MTKGLSLLQRISLPLHSFSTRTEMLLEAIPLRSDDRVLEVGVGPGYNAYCLAPLVASWTAADIAADLIRTLPPAPRGQVNFIVGDASSVEFGAAHRGRFTKVISSDALQVIPDYDGFFRVIATVLAPGGEAFVTFPNVKGDPRVLTAFCTLAELEGALRDSGLHAAEIATVTTNRGVQWVKRVAVAGPAQFARRMRSRRPRTGSGATSEPVNFDETFFHQIRHVGGLRRRAVNAYMEFLVIGCRLFAPRFFRFEPAGVIDPSRLWLRLRHANENGAPRQS